MGFKFNRFNKQYSDESQSSVYFNLKNNIRNVNGKSKKCKWNCQNHRTTVRSHVRTRDFRDGNLQVRNGFLKQIFILLFVRSDLFMLDSFLWLPLTLFLRAHTPHCNQIYVYFSGNSYNNKNKQVQADCDLFIQIKKII